MFNLNFGFFFLSVIPLLIMSSVIVVSYAIILVKFCRAKCSPDDSIYDQAVEGKNTRDMENPTHRRR